MPRRNLKQLYKDEFKNYSFQLLQKDAMAGLTVAAVALPLALAFGVSSGATASAGLVTAILAGIAIGLLSGAPYQISGPTGAMSAVLILLAQQYGLQGIWIAGLVFRVFAPGHRVVETRTLHRFHPGTRDHRVYQRYRFDHLHRSNRQPPGGHHTCNRICTAKTGQFHQRRFCS